MLYKKINFLILSLLIIFISCYDNKKVIYNYTLNDSISDNIFIEPEENPCFKGGTMELFKFIENNINKKIVGDTNLAQGTVVISFVIDTCGNLSEFKVKKSYHCDIDNEFIRVLKLMPPWYPGRILIDNKWEKKSTSYYMPLKIPFLGYDLD